MIKLDPHIKEIKSNKSSDQESTILNKGRLMRINKWGLLIINKPILLRNENGYRFHSHHSKANLTIRTQSTTITLFARLNLLYIYKKWKCVESLTIPGKGVALSKSRIYIGYINQFFATPIVHSSLQSIRGGREFTLIRIARCNGWAG